jgi:hypothetical protein
LNRRKAQLFLLVITVPIVLAVVYSLYSICNGYRPSLELILGVAGGVFVEAFLATLIASKRNKKKP